MENDNNNIDKENDDNNNVDVDNDMDKNINLFLYLTNIDSYINDYLNILYLKKKKNTDRHLIIDSYYINFFNKIILSSSINDVGIVTNKQIEYTNLIEKKICSEVNNEYINNTSISYLYLYYIIRNWDNLPSNVFFYNFSNENTFPLEMYIVPKKNIEIFSNNYGIFKLNSGDIFLSKSEKSKIKSNSGISFIQWWKYYIKKDLPEIFEYCPELVFSIKRSNIKKNGKEYYVNILNHINKYPFGKELYYLDRCWYYIFL